MAKEKIYLAYIDTDGLKEIQDLDDYEKRLFWARLSDKTYPRFPAYRMVMEAKSKIQKSPEVYAFYSELDLAALMCYSNDCNEQLAQEIRKHGEPIFLTDKKVEKT
jgi:hypothetical protein